MKQPMAYGKGKAHKVRQLRTAASNLKKNAKVYSRIDKWEEFEVGTPNYYIKLTLKLPWSFSPTEYKPETEVSSTAEAMRAVHLTYLPTEEMIIEAREKLIPDIGSEENWETRLAALCEVKK